MAATFLVLYAVISLVNHYLFRTYALDLGLYTNTLYDYAHFQWNDSLVFRSEPENLLADHFDLYLPILSPLGFVFGSYTLLIVQIVALIFGGLGVYRFASVKLSNNSLALFGAARFFLFFGIFSSLSFDYHSIVVGSCLIPWLFIGVEKKSLSQTLIWGVLILFAKETASIYLFFICLALLCLYWKDAERRMFLALLMALSVLYAFVIFKFIMPALSVNGEYHHFHYAYFGENMKEAIWGAISNPIETFKAFFTNHMEVENADFVKTESMIFIFLSGFWLLFRKPVFLIILAPLLAQKYLHDDPSIWSFGGHYNIEFAPILVLGSIWVLGEMKSKKWQYWTQVLLIVGTLVVTFKSLDQTIFYTDKSRVRFYQAKHYQKHYSIEDIYELMKRIPQSAIVSTQSPFLPHLAWRDQVYQFPAIGDADYILCSLNESTYPITELEFQVKIEQLKTDSDWLLVQEVNGNMLFERIKKDGMVPASF